jgi:hypothetical protein
MPDSRADSIDITDVRHSSSQEQDIESNVPTAGHREPPPAIKITAYRLTVTAATISFGLAKYLLTGNGKSLQANVLDFVMGVPLALLYVIPAFIILILILTFIFDHEGCSG